MSQVFDDIEAAIDHMDDLRLAADFGRVVAIGVWADDPVAPGVTAIVREGQLYSLAIADAYTKLSCDELTAIISAVIINAFYQWRLEVQRWTEAASENPGVMLDYVNAED